MILTRKVLEILQCIPAYPVKCEHISLGWLFRLRRIAFLIKEQIFISYSL